MVPLKSKRLDFVVLNHDEDLISAGLRAQLADRQGTQRNQAAPAISAAFVVTTNLTATGDAVEGKPNLPPALVAKDLQAHAPLK
jgi:hypothetical protein